jgi:hypothetical protein
MKRSWFIGPLAVASLLVLECQAERASLRASMSSEEFYRCGLYKLDDRELANLEAWLEKREQPPTQSRTAAPAKTSTSTVSFNQSSRKYHCPTCSGALRCTRNCVSLSKAEAVQRGGVPCQICGGSCE